MNSLLRNVLLASACLTLLGYTVHVLRGPQGIPYFLEKREQVRQLESQNEQLRKQNERKRERIEELKNSRSEQELAIREHSKMQKAGETTFVLADH